MLKSLILTTFLLSLTVNVFAQTNQITVKPKRIVYTRKFLKANDSKRTFAVRYPIISGVTNLALKRKIENTVKYWSVFETSLRENLTGDTWLESLDYKVNYNKNGIFDISLILEGSGAYPDTATRNLVVNLKTGEQTKFRDVFKANTLDKLAALVDKKLQAEKREIILQMDKDVASGNETAETSESLKEDVRKLEFTAQDFDEFSISDKGVTILYDAGFPHVIQALQPDGRYFFTYAELKSFIKPDNLLRKFVR